MRGCVLVFFLAVLFHPIANAAERESSRSFEALEVEYTKFVQPLLTQYCNDCHSTDDKEGELDLQRFSNLEQVRRDPHPWQQVVKMLASGEMPPDESEQLLPEDKQKLIAWVQEYLDQEARANAGDPGPVVLRRLNNAEYTNTIRDLTQVDLHPADQFPVDGAAGEGFTNTGIAMAMSPALVTKYFDAAKKIADHAVLLPDGFRFSTSTTRRDWTNEVLNQIRHIYEKHTVDHFDRNLLNKWDNVKKPKELSDNTGRVDLVPYVSALIRHREQLFANRSRVQQVAAEEGLNAKYFGILAETLLEKQSGSLVLDQIRERMQSASLEEVPTIVELIRDWQEKLWKYNVVGQNGIVEPWQVPVDILRQQQKIQLKLEPDESQKDRVLYLQVGTAGEANEADVVRWNRPRIEYPGRKSIDLVDLRAAAIVFDRVRAEILEDTSSYLQAVYELQEDLQLEGAEVDLAQVAEEQKLDVDILKAWLAYLGFAYGEVPIQHYLTSAYRHEQHQAIAGWTYPEVPVVSIVSNAGDKAQKIPGEVAPQAICVHPAPDRWVVAGWKSLLQGKVQVAGAVQDAHNSCGNGVSWAITLRRGLHQEILQSGQMSKGKQATIEPIEEIEVRPGDFISLQIGPRDGDHTCDLTQIDMTIEEIGGNKRRWSLVGDCAGDLDDGNPHADRLGNQAVWHFFTERVDGNANKSSIPDDSLLASWLVEKEPAQKVQIAEQLETFLTQPLPVDTKEANRKLYQHLTSFHGVLLSQLDYSRLASRVNAEELGDSSFGIAPDQFGLLANGTKTAAHDLVTKAPRTIEVKIPSYFLEGATFVTSATMAEAGSAQVKVSFDAPANEDFFSANREILVVDESEQQAVLKQSMEDFRSIFPSSMCYSKIIPVDTGVAIVQFHREHEHLSRLMLDEDEAAQLDRLWEELRYISQDALTSLTTYEQLMEFATQDSDPGLFEHLREPVQQNAKAFNQLVLDAEAVQIDALVDFANQAYRRPLTREEEKSIRDLYSKLRTQETNHEDAFRLALARVLTSPTFLYRLEKQGSEVESNLITDWELANRLSYFLWSSMPDAQLRELATNQQLHNPETLLAQTSQMLQHDRIRQLAIEFGCQWLHIRDFDQHDEKSERHFPNFNEIRSDMYEESIQFFTNLFQTDGSILDLIDADYTFLNEKLAKHYGIPDVTGIHWRRVDGVKQYHRGGILTQATTLSKQSGASRTSAILRGNWIYESLLGERLPRPPKDVPVLPEDVPEELTERQLIEKHSSAPACAKCHLRIDGYGFSLENFDAIGRYREKDHAQRVIDTEAILQDGTKLDGFQGLQQYILTTQRDTFVKQFCRKLLGYALGRSVQLSDEPLLEEMMQKLANNDYRISQAIETIVLSKQFQKIRGPSHPGNQQTASTN